MKNAAPWMVVLLALSAVYPVAKAVKSSTPAAEEKKAGASPEAGTAADETCRAKDGVPPWCEPVRLIRDFFGLETAAEATRDKSLKEVAERAKDTGYALRLLVALVPLPGDPRFDEALDAIRRGFADSGYLIDRAWLPWAVGEAKSDGGSQKAPGILLFRGPSPEEAGKLRPLSVVLLVGETPRAGIQKQAFREALDLAAGLEQAADDPNPAVGILGPSFSGAAESLRLAMAAWRKQEQERASARRPFHFRMATGSATASGLEAIFREADTSFCRTVLPDSDLQEAAFAFLRDGLGWDLGRMALLTEADTSYGRSLLKQEIKEAKSSRKERGDPVLVPFPSHISDLRNAFQEKGKTAPEVSSLESQTRGHEVLDLDVADRERSVDLVPVSNPLAIRESELMLANLLETMSREGIRYAGILATNVKDKLFLAEEIRRFLPDTVLFTFDSNLLYAHSQYAGIMDGTLVLTTAPLFTEGAPGAPSSLELAARERRQFVSGFEQGTYEAVRYLLEAGYVKAPQVWIAAIGNGSIWPVARLEAKGSSVRSCGPQPEGPPAPAAAEGTGFTGKDDLKLLLMALLLCLLSVWMEREALLEPIAGSEVDSVPGNRLLLTLGSLLLASAAGILLVVAALPLWGSSFVPRHVLWEPTQILYLGALVLAYAFLIAKTARYAPRGPRGVHWLVWLLGGGLWLLLLAVGLQRLCIPEGQVELFHLRARALSSGFSPLLSLAALGGAICAWLFNELVRRRLMARLAIDCPLPALCEPSAAGCLEVLASLKELLTQTFPAGRRPWLLTAVAFLPPVVLLWGTIQPIAEPKNYGRFFIALLAAAVALAALSFYRFLRLWLGVQWLLERLDNASPELAAAFAAIGKAVEWRPIKSFGWRMPPFRTLVLSVRRLRKLVKVCTLSLSDYPEVFDASLTGMFEAETREGSRCEIEHRNKIERIFSEACGQLSTRLAMPGVREFLALRVTAYLRYVFAHMRSCLIGTMVPGFLILMAVTSYAFQPKQFVSTAVWLALAAAVALTCWTFVQMDRNATLSRIGDTKPGQVTFDRAFWGNFLTYAGIPLLGLVAAWVPGLGRLLGRLADQLLRVTGGG